MEKFAFKMQFYPGQKAEYIRRHDAIWPELCALLKESGVSDYSIYFDEETGVLFGVSSRCAGHSMTKLPNYPIMQRWWDHMADIMVTQSGNESVVIALAPVFHLP